ncbi:MAG: glutamyl-tRNA reductase [Syntrophales bacterium]|nr:glutamyl-tRNA reductase [Syntrophales bacterium]
MDVLLIGMNHKTAPLEIRERLSLSCGEGIHPLPVLKDTANISEYLYLATCNRVEIMAVTENAREAEKMLKDLIFSHGNLSREEMARCLYIHYNEEAVRHLFRVAASLDSLIMGEPQILGQLKDAYRKAVEGGTTGLFLNKILHHAFRTAKRIRTETGIANHAVSVSYAAVELAKKIFANLRDKEVLLIGAGEMSELAARHLLKNGAARIIVTNRTYDRAVALAREFGGEAMVMEDLTRALERADIVISSTGAPGYVIKKDMIGQALKKRRNRLLFLIDIAVPRDIEPTVGDLDNVYLYNMDHLQDIADENRQRRQEEAKRAEIIIAEEIQRYTEWYHTLEVVPTIVSLKEKVEAIVQGEMERLGARMKGMGEEERQVVDQLIHGVVNKILHDPITALKEESQEASVLAYTAAVRRLFRLDTTRGTMPHPQKGVKSTEEGSH